LIEVGLESHSRLLRHEKEALEETKARNLASECHEHSDAQRNHLLHLTIRQRLSTTLWDPLRTLSIQMMSIIEVEAKND